MACVIEKSMTMSFTPFFSPKVACCYTHWKDGSTKLDNCITKGYLEICRLGIASNRKNGRDQSIEGMLLLLKDYWWALRNTIVSVNDYSSLQIICLRCMNGFIVVVSVQEKVKIMKLTIVRKRVDSVYFYLYFFCICIRLDVTNEIK